jgi:hypothetical protein
VHKNGGLFFGTAKESDAGDSGFQSIGTRVVNVTLVPLTESGFVKGFGCRPVER